MVPEEGLTGILCKCQHNDTKGSGSQDNGVGPYSGERKKRANDVERFTASEGETFQYECVLSARVLHESSQLTVRDPAEDGDNPSYNPDSKSHPARFDRMEDKGGRNEYTRANCPSKEI